MPASSKPFYLVSASPRRRDLLERLGISPLVTPTDTKEYLDPTLSPEKLTLSLAQQKIDSFLAAQGSSFDSSSFALSADTIVHIEGQHLGKPRDRKEAKGMLLSLSSKEHLVSTGFVLMTQNGPYRGVETSQVTFRDLSEDEIDFYLDFNEWTDAAGAYKIQETGEILINKINGSYSNVMGLPLSRIYAILKANNFWS